MIAYNRKIIFNYLIAIAVISLITAILTKPSSLNPILFIYLFVLPPLPFLILAMRVRKMDKEGKYLFSIGAVRGAMIGALLAIGIPYGILIISTLTYSGGGANIGVGLLLLGTPIYLAMATSAGWSKGMYSHIESLKRPMDVTALIMVALAMSGKEITTEMKDELKTLFHDIFKLDEHESHKLLNHMITLLQQDEYPINNIEMLLEPSINSFSEDQSSSSLELIMHIANFKNPATAAQNKIISDLKKVFQDKFSTSN